MDLNADNKAVRKFEDNIICINCGSRELTYYNKERFCEKCKYKNYKLYENKLGIDWNYEKRDIRKIDYEINKYNTWARREMSKLNYDFEEKDRWYDYEIYDENPPIREQPSVLGEVRDIEGWDVLDVGGSCVDSWRFLPAGAASVNQVEPAPESQRLAVQRLEEALSDSSINWRDKVLFHTVVAEHLPFQKDTFDMVFSRSSIHHTSRPESLRECFRVLKPGGYFLVVEPRYSTFLDWLRIAYRKLRDVERGADKPLIDEDISEIKMLSSYTAEIRYKLLNPFKIIFGSNMDNEFLNSITRRDISGIDFLLEKALILAKK